MKRTIAALAGGAALLALAQGCTMQSDASRFREPLPQNGDAALSVPGSTVSGTTTQSVSPGASVLRLQTTGSGSGGTAGYATFYEFTRVVADSVDWATVAILGAIEAVASSPPTSIDANHAVWGPGRGNALDPVSWRLTVTAVGSGAYDYEVDGRPHLSTSDADWRAILTGHGYDHTSASHRSGNFTIDRDALHALDPVTHPDTGSVRVDYDARTYPATIAANVTTNDGSGSWFDVTVTHDKDGSGQLAVSALADIDTPKDGTNENVAENSRWNSTGAGRADVAISGGNLGSTKVLASQCWSDAFAQTYYTDNVNYQPTVGDPSTCAFSQAQFSP
jgi:hypothetical protein